MHYAQLHINVSSCTPKIIVIIFIFIYHKVARNNDK